MERLHPRFADKNLFCVLDEELLEYLIRRAVIAEKSELEKEVRLLRT